MSKVITGILLTVGLILLAAGIVALVSPETIAGAFGSHPEWQWDGLWGAQQVTVYDVSPSLIRSIGIGATIIGGGSLLIGFLRVLRRG